MQSYLHASALPLGVFWETNVMRRAKMHWSEDSGFKSTCALRLKQQRHATSYQSIDLKPHSQVTHSHWWLVALQMLQKFSDHSQ